MEATAGACVGSHVTSEPAVLLEMVLTTCGVTDAQGSLDCAPVSTSSPVMRFTRLPDGSVTSQKDAAIAVDSAELTLVGVQVQGAEAGIAGKNGLRLKATKKTRIVATTGHGIVMTSNGDLTVSDAGVEAAEKAIKGTVNANVKLAAGAHVRGKKGALDLETNVQETLRVLERVAAEKRAT